MDMTMKEYRMKMEAHNLRLIDKERDMHWQAFLNHAVTSTVASKDGKSQEPRYKDFKEFFDYDALLRSVKGEDKEEREAKAREERRKKAKTDRLSRLMMRANQAEVSIKDE